MPLSVVEMTHRRMLSLNIQSSLFVAGMCSNELAQPYCICSASPNTYWFTLSIHHLPGKELQTYPARSGDHHTTWRIGLFKEFGCQQQIYQARLKTL
jgi:hypothetical protein